MTLKFKRWLRSRSVVANRWLIKRSTSTRFERGVSTRRVGFSWSDSSRMSTSMGSLRACIWAPICSSTRDGETWYGKPTTTTSPFSRT